jgi:acetate---CoA ligase (ADP-forming)
MEAGKLFFPESIAILGVSPSPANLAKVIIQNLGQLDFRGEIYCVGRQGGEVWGRKIVRSLDEIDGVPDLAVVLVPADAVPSALEACGTKGIGHVVIETAGFTEFEAGRSNLEAEILSIASKWNMTIVGPNCVGMINMENGLALPFFPLDYKHMRQGPVSFISQSGGLVHEVMRRCCCEGLGLSKMISIGNKLMLDENDILEILEHDPATKVVGLYLENVKNGPRLMNLAYSATKPIVMLKANRHDASRQIARFHTAALAGDDAVTEAALKQCGIHRAHNFMEMMDLFKVFGLPPMRGIRVALVSRSGGQAVLLSDAASRHGFALAHLSPNIFKEVDQRVRGGVIRRTNPIDLGDVFDNAVFVNVIEGCLREKDVDAVVYVHGYGYADDTEPTRTLITRLKELTYAHDKPVVLCMTADKENWFSMKEAADFPIFSEADHGLKALAASLTHYRKKSKAQGLPSSSAGTATAGGGISARGILDPGETFALLRQYGIPVPEYAMVHDETEALNCARRIGYPVALKAALPRVVHKTEAGAVRLNLADDAALKGTIREMQATRYLLQKMIPAGQEIIIGGKRDAEFGPVLLFGLGGIFVEALRETAIRLAPVDEPMAAEMIGETRAATVLSGYRGHPTADTKGLVRCLVNVSRLMVDHPEIVTLDLNPIIVLEEGEGCFAVDARIETA